MEPKDNAYEEPVLVSPDGTKLVAIQAEPAQERKVYLVESSPKDQLQPKLLSYDYLKPGDRIAHDRPRLLRSHGEKSHPHQGGSLSEPVVDFGAALVAGWQAFHLSI